MILWMRVPLIIFLLWGCLILVFCPAYWVGWNVYMGKLRRTKSGSQQYKRTIPSCRDKLITCNSSIEIIRNVEHQRDSRKTRLNFIPTIWNHVTTASEIFKSMLKIKLCHSNMSAKLFKNSEWRVCMDHSFNEGKNNKLLRRF